MTRLKQRKKPMKFMNEIKIMKTVYLHEIEIIAHENNV